MIGELPACDGYAPGAGRAPVTGPGRFTAMRERMRADDGFGTAEYVILLPLIVVLIFAAPQLAEQYFAHEAATSAAQAGARAASTLDAPGGSGQQAAETFLAKAGSGTLEHTQVTETRTATTVTLHITGDVPAVIPLPGYQPSVDVTVTEARERFIPQGTP